MVTGIVYFKKLSEDDQQVRYSFGAEHGDMHRTLVVNKDTVRPEPEDGKPDYEFRKAAGNIVVSFRDRGEWPPHALHAIY